MRVTCCILWSLIAFVHAPLATHASPVAECSKSVEDIANLFEIRQLSTSDYEAKSYARFVGDKFLWFFTWRRSIRFPNVRYHSDRAAVFNPEFELDVAVQAKILAKDLSEKMGIQFDPRPVSEGGHLLGDGGFRVAFVHPQNPFKVVKVYSPFMNGPKTITFMIQREMGMYRYLQEAGVPIAETEFPYPESGIVIQERMTGGSAEEIFGEKGYVRGTDRALDHTLALVERHDNLLYPVMEERNGVISRVDTSTGRIVAVEAIDSGYLYRNIHRDRRTGTYKLIDW